MAEYIEREAAQTSCRKYSFAESYDAFAVDCILKAIPAADVAPVVRCKDCKHYDLGVCLKIYSDGNMHTEAWQSRRPEDFCSYGERRGGADNG